ELHLLRLAAHHEMQRQALEIAVLQGEQFLQAHGARHAAIAVEEDDAPRWPGLEPTACDREDRSDAAAGCERHAGALPRRPRVRREAAIWRQHVEPIAGSH